ncbi:diacylglycerol/lipid kinase family protein [Arabiibacter massiliensis]|uniref:diacylglycerol/lipid kinase family protein n=1 Tax=Arabiibacter massiliensis TaxID=1870985 RepID=UPI0009BAB492|nr:diacylglycerol kinase family protein [Arabiibacter massiliensis]
MAEGLGKVLLIANPAAQNGNGGPAADRAAALLRAQLGEDAVVLARTAGPRHASEIAERAEGCGAVIALGGDGVIHEVANGLMRRPAAERPVFGIVPVGSGNDYARTLGVSEKVDEACAQLLAAEALPTDVGCVNGQWFVETLSFGLDAAIALDTMERRVRTGRTGTALYAEAGVNQLLHHLETRRYTASFDGGEPVQADSIMFAVQVGPYYGGGFKICPDARVDDGLLDVCVAHPPVGVARALYIFLRAKSGGHTGFKQMELRRATALHVEFDEAPPAQMDGEHIDARIFDVSVEPAALRVLRP